MKTLTSPFPFAHVGDIPFAVASLQQAARHTVSAALELRERPAAYPLRLANAYCVALASRDAAYKTLLTTSGINFPDGAPIAWAMKRSARHSTQVRGPSFFLETIRAGLNHQVRHFFLGASTETLDRLTATLEERYRGVHIAGALAPPFGTAEEILTEEVLQTIRSAGADIVWVGLGTPKQDFVAERLSTALRRPCAGVGAAFDFVAGTTKEAPAAVQGSGFEWLYRFVREPRRLWRRYLIGNVQFAIALARDHR